MLTYGWTLLVSLPVAFLGDFIAQTFEREVIRREMASRDLPLPPNQEVTWEEHVMDHPAARGSKRRKFFRAARWTFTFGFVDRSLAYLWYEVLTPLVVGDHPSFWIELVSGITADLLYVPASIAIVFSLTASLDFHYGVSDVVKKVKNDLGKTMLVGFLAYVPADVVLCWTPSWVDYLVWWVTWSLWGIYFSHRAHLPLQHPLLPLGWGMEEDESGAPVRIEDID